MVDDQREAGRIPRTVECELTYGLGEACIQLAKFYSNFSKHTATHRLTL